MVRKLALSGKSGKINPEADANYPIKPIAMHTRALDDASHGGVRDGHFINVLQEVHNANKKHDMKVNLPQ